MSLDLRHLDEITRPLMLDEISLDISAAKLYLSDRLSVNGKQDYPLLLNQAATSFDEEWLADQLQSDGRLNSTYLRKNPKGGFSTVTMPSNAAQTLAEGEFCRFYMRGLCRRALAEGTHELVVYRARVVQSPRPESEARIGSIVSPTTLLDDLRTNIAVDTALGVPAGPNSGLCVGFCSMAERAI